MAIRAPDGANNKRRKTFCNSDHSPGFGASCAAMCTRKDLSAAFGYKFNHLLD